MLDHNIFLYIQNIFSHPQKSASDYSAMEAAISASMARHGLTYLQLLRRVAVTCDEFILFVREKKVGRII